VLQQQINQIRRFLSNAQTPDSVIAPTYRRTLETTEIEDRIAALERSK
jgi:hypothetical protein